MSPQSVQRCIRPARPVAALLALLVVMLPLLWKAVPAHADGGPEVSITLTSVSPSTVPAAKDARITIKGTVTNTSKVAMTLVQVAFWRSTDAIEDSSSLSSIVASPWDVPVGARMGLEGEEPDQNLFPITSDTSPSFEPGQTASFTVSARVDQLDLGSESGVRLLGVHVRARPQGDQNHTVGRARVLMPMQASAPTTGVSPVVVISSRPSLVSPGVLSDDHLAGELRGRLNGLLTQGERAGATMLIDPALYDEVTTMAQGYKLLNGQAGTGQELAKAWLIRFERVLATRDSFRLPYGNPDLLAAAHSGRTELPARLTSALGTNHPLSALPLAICDPKGQLDATLLDYVKALKPTVVFGSQPQLATKQVIRGLTVVNADPGLFAGGPGPSPSATKPQVVGRLLSELAVNHRGGAVALISEPTVAVIAALDALPAGTGVNQLQVAGAGALVTLSKPPAIAEPLLSDLDRSSHAVQLWGNLTGNADAASRAADQLVARALSANFNRNTAAAQAWLDQAMTGVPDVRRAKISVVASKSFVVNAEDAELPITVVNGTDSTIKVKLTFRSENPQRISLPDTAVVQIEPGQSRSMQFKTVAYGNGAVNVVAQLVTEQGDPVGAPATFTVTATSLGRVGWIIMIGSGVVLIGATVLRIKQVGRERAKAAQTKAEQTQAAQAAAEVFDTTRDLNGRPHP